MAEKLYEIYKTFTEQLVTNGWKGEIYGWTETTRNNPEEGSWILFELDNGFNLGFYEPLESTEENVSLEYWFEDESDDDTAIMVESLEQLLELLN